MPNFCESRCAASSMASRARGSGSECGWRMSISALERRRVTGGCILATARASGVIDSCRMQPLRLRFLHDTGPHELTLDVGMHHVGPAGGGLGVVEEGPGALACFCVDRRGVWLTVGSGAR